MCFSARSLCESGMGDPWRRWKLQEMRQHLLSSGHHSSEPSQASHSMSAPQFQEGGIYFSCWDALHTKRSVPRARISASFPEVTNSPFWGVLASPACRGIFSHSRSWHLQKPSGKQKFKPCPTQQGAAQPQHYTANPTSQSKPRAPNQL